MLLLDRLPMRFSAPILLALPVIVVAAALSTISYWQGEAAADELAQQNLVQVHDQIDGHVRNLLSQPRRVVQLNTALLDRGQLSPTDAHTWRETLVEQARAFDMLSAISWGGVDGQATWIARYGGKVDNVYYAIKDQPASKTMTEHRVLADGRIDPEPAGDPFPFVLAGRLWYDTPVKAGKATWCKPYPWVGGGEEGKETFGISFGRPYYDDGGQLLGVVDADLSLQDLSRYLKQLQIAEHGRAFIIDREGRLIASSTHAVLADAQGDRLKAVDSQAPHIRRAAAWINGEGGGLDMQTAPRHFTISVNDEAELAMVSPLSLDTGIDWLIVTSVPQTDFTAPLIAGQQRALLFAAIAVIVIIALGLWLGRRMVEPVLNVVAHARRVGAGDLEGKLQLTEAPELRMLSREINTMVDDLRDRMRLRESLALAMEVQQNLLPSDTPAVQGLDIAGHSTYCDETGGDYYDYLEVTGLSDRAAAIVIGDVMGHGIAAAMMMANARGILRSRAQQADSLGELLTHLNELLVPDTGGHRFMTMLLMVVDAGRREIRWASAGHDPPFIYDPQRDAFLDLQGGGLPLGIMEGEEYTESAIRDVGVGWLIVSATDGLWEASNGAGEQYGRDRLRAAIRQHADLDAAALSEKLREELEAYIGQSTHDDDITFVVVRTEDVPAKEPADATLQAGADI